MVKKNIINYSESDDSSDEKNSKVKVDYSKLKMVTKTNLSKQLNVDIKDDWDPNSFAIKLNNSQQVDEKNDVQKEKPKNVMILPQAKRIHKYQSYDFNKKTKVQEQTFYQEPQSIQNQDSLPKNDWRENKPVDKNFQFNEENIISLDQSSLLDDNWKLKREQERVKKEIRGTYRAPLPTKSGKKKNQLQQIAFKNFQNAQELEDRSLEQRANQINAKQKYGW